MQHTENNKGSEVGSKKEARKQIEKKLETALASFKPLLGEKKFKKRIKKAGKVLSRDLNGALKDKTPKNGQTKLHPEHLEVQQ